MCRLLLWGCYSISWPAYHQSPSQQPPSIIFCPAMLNVLIAEYWQECLVEVLPIELFVFLRHWLRRTIWHDQDLCHYNGSQYSREMRVSNEFCLLLAVVVLFAPGKELNFGAAKIINQKQNWRSSQGYRFGLESTFKGQLWAQRQTMPLWVRIEIKMTNKMRTEGRVGIGFWNIVSTSERRS